PETPRRTQANNRARVACSPVFELLLRNSVMRLECALQRPLLPLGAKLLAPIMTSPFNVRWVDRLLPVFESPDSFPIYPRLPAPTPQLLIKPAHKFSVFP